MWYVHVHTWLGYEARSAATQPHTCTCRLKYQLAFAKAGSDISGSTG